MSGVGSAVSAVERLQSSEQTPSNQCQEKMMSSHFPFERQDPDKFTANGIIKIQHLHMTSALLVHYDVYLCW